MGSFLNNLLLKRERSTSATTSRSLSLMLKTSLPPPVVVSMLLVRLTNPVPEVLKSSINVSKYLRLLPCRSSRHTTGLSLLQKCSRHLSTSLIPFSVQIVTDVRVTFLTVSKFQSLLLRLINLVLDAEL